MGPNRLYTVPCVSRLSVQKPENRDASSASGRFRKAWKHMAHVSGVKLPPNRCTEICPARLTDILCESYLQKQQSPASSHSARPTHYTLTSFIFQVFSKNNLGENIRNSRSVFIYFAQNGLILSKNTLISLLKSRKRRLFINNLLKKGRIRGIIPYTIKRKTFDRPVSTRSGVYARIRRI